MKEEIKTPSSKKNIYQHIAISFVFILAGIWIFFNPDLFQDFPLLIVRNPIVIKSIGVIGVLFFGATGLIGIKKLFIEK